MGFAGCQGAIQVSVLTIDTTLLFLVQVSVLTIDTTLLFLGKPKT